jgi:hypothetical protein
MNPDPDEKRIKELFRGLRLADERRAPRFASTLRSASETAGRVGGKRIAWALVTMVVTLGAAAALFVVVRDHRPPVPEQPGPGEHRPVTGETGQKPDRVVRPETKQNSDRDVEVERTIAPVRGVARAGSAAALISQWESPTEFLLRTPGNELINTVPRLGEPFMEFGQPGAQPHEPKEKNF